MTASEFFFLVCGLVLGTAAGAALLDILRAHPPRPEVRLTVTHNALPPRFRPRVALADAGLASRIGPRRPSVAVAVSRGRDPALAGLAGAARVAPVGVAAAAGRAVDAARADARAATTPAGPRARSGGGGRSAPGTDSPPSAPDEEGQGSAGDEASSGPCAGERRVADERCTVAALSAEQAEVAAAALREAQRAYDDATSREEAAVRSADARQLRQAKDEAQQAFRRARDAARSRKDLERAATAWLTTIDRINRDAREAVTVAERERHRTAELVVRMEELGLAADAARISSEVAAQACQEARERLAACEEARTGAYAAEAISVPVAPDWDAFPEEPDRAISPIEPDGRQPAIVMLLRGDRDTLGRIVTALGGESADDRRRYQLLLSDLVDAIVARAIEESVLDFPEKHQFWGDFTRRQCRDIATALASLGYRFDGLGGFSSGRAPSQRDLSLAVGYAGLDPMRIRRWPMEAEMDRLYQKVTVAADEYLATAAGDLSLGEMVSVLGRRAEGLAELWNNWGRVRPLLLAAAR